MAAIVEMGEVDEIHSNEGSIKDGASVNGDACEYKETVEEEPTTTEEAAGDLEQVSSSSSTDHDDEEKSIEDDDDDDDDDDEEVVSQTLENGGGSGVGDGGDDDGEVVVEDDEEEEQEEEDIDEEEVDEEEEEDDGLEKMQVDSEDQVHEINSDGDEYDSSDANKSEEPSTTTTRNMTNGLNSSDEVLIEPDRKTSASSKKTNADSSGSIVINDSGEGDDVVVLDDSKDLIEQQHENASDKSNDKQETTTKTTEVKKTEQQQQQEEDDDAEVIALEDTPTKKKKRIVIESGPPRRSSRNLHRERKSYVEDEEDELKNAMQRQKDKEKQQQQQQQIHSSEESSDIEEVMPQDPLAVSDLTASVPSEPITKPPKKTPRISSSTIVVKDTKCLAEIASKSTANNNNNKKEPTLVIIDTNSILSGRGPVPVSSQKSSSSISNSYSMLPMALPAQGVYPANMRATITPIPMTQPVSHPKPVPAPPPPPPPVLPTLTDDMFVVEAPSFIVPYVYEKPPVKDLREFVKNLEREIAEQKQNEDKQKKSEVGDEKTETDEETVTKKDGDNEKENKEESEVQTLQISSTGAIDIEVKKSPATYFESPLGKFFMGIGYSLVQEVVQNDVLKQQKRKRDREGAQNPETLKTIASLLKNLEYTKENNEPYHMDTKKCEFCSFKTESSLAMAFHLETPHMKNYVYRCNFCPYEVRSPHDILFHMEVLHGVRGRLERAPAFHQCPNCSFEDNQKGKLSRHMVTCARKFKPDRNLEPPADYEPPAKIPRAPRMKQQSLSNAAAVYQVMARSSQYQMMSKMAAAGTIPVMQRGRGRPSLGNTIKQSGVRTSSNMIYKQANMSGGSVLLPTNYQLSGNQLYQQQQQQQSGNSLSKMKPVQQPSISITPLPRASSTSSGLTIGKPGDSNPKNSFVICEICDGYIKDLEQLRNHMQWIHKVKIHPKMIYNRPPLNCQKCQFRFFTDQGLERHLLGSHGLVTSSMQEAANRSKDAGRCPVCGRVYQWKLLNHVARDHNMTLKPAHLSYKCTVCTATFGMYKQFESHVYSAHSVVAKRVMDKKNSSTSGGSGGGSSSSSIIKSESVLKPLKINDEITIIPQPAKPPTNGAGSKDDSTTTPSTSGGVTTTSSINRNSTIGFSNGNPGTSKSSHSDILPTSTSLSRSERLARRKTSSQTDN